MSKGSEEIAWVRQMRRTVVWLLLLAMLSTSWWLLTTWWQTSNGAVQAATEAKSIENERELYPSEWGVAHPEGLTYSAQHRLFYVLDKNPSEAASGQSTVIAISPYDDLASRATFDFNIGDSINLAFDDDGNRLFMLGGSPLALVQVPAGANGALDTANVTRVDASRFGLINPEGMTVDHRGKFLFILDRANSHVVRIEIKDALDQARFETFDLAAKGLTYLRGIAVNLENHHVFVMRPGKKMIYELTDKFKYVAEYNIRPLKLADPLALVFGYSSDLTDDEKLLNLFIADSAAPTANAADQDPEDQDPEDQDLQDEEAATFRAYLPFVEAGENGVDLGGEVINAEVAATETFGRIVELGLDVSNSGSGSVSSANVDAQLTLLNTFRTSAFNPPSPDPTGITYDSNKGRLILADSEVDEIGRIFNDSRTNVYRLTRANPPAVEFRGNTTHFSREPTGIAFDPGDPNNPGDNRYFFSDDDANRIYTVQLGLNGDFDRNDRVTSFLTTGFGSQDAEGVEYDPNTGRLWLVDDANREVYEVSTTGQRFSQFDILQYNIRAPEGIELTPDGEIWIVGRNTTTVFRLSRTGTLLGTHTVSASVIKFSGLEIAPATSGAGNSLFIIDRGIDNDVDSRENDGRMFEFTLP